MAVHFFKDFSKYKMSEDVRFETTPPPPPFSSHFPSSKEVEWFGLWKFCAHKMQKQHQAPDKAASKSLEVFMVQAQEWGTHYM